MSTPPRCLCALGGDPRDPDWCERLRALTPPGAIRCGDPDGAWTAVVLGSDISRTDSGWSVELPGIDPRQLTRIEYRQVDRSLTIERGGLLAVPAYVAQTGSRVLVSTDLVSLLAALPAVRPSVAAVLDALVTGYAIPPETIYQGVSFVRGAERLTFRPGRSVQSWVAPESTSDPSGRPAEAVVVALTVAVKQAVAGRRAAVLLSGGLDSALLAAVAVRESERVAACCASFAPAAGPQVDLAAEIVDTLGLDRRTAALDETIVGRWVELLDAHLAPLEGLGPAAVDAAVEVATPDVTLSAVGADEQFLGSLWLRRRSDRWPWRSLRPPWFGPADARQSYGVVPPRWFAWLTRMSLRAELLAPEAAEAWGGLAEAPPRAPLPPEQLAELPEPQALRRFELASRLEGYLLPLLTQSGRRYGATLAAPYLDPRVNSVAASLPARALGPRRAGKPVLRAAAKRLLAPDLAVRPKLDRSRPEVAWLLGDPLPGPVAEALSPGALAEVGWFDPVVVHHWLQRLRQYPHSEFNRLRTQVLLTAVGLQRLALRHGWRLG